MVTKISLFGVLMAILYLPVGAYGQDLSPVQSVEGINIAHIPNDTIMVISQDETDTPGYVHQKYAYINQACPGGFQIVDYYGAPVDPNDASLQTRERSMCSDLAFDRADGD
jgi:hypothetical protein